MSRFRFSAPVMLTLGVFGALVLLLRRGKSSPGYVAPMPAPAEPVTAAAPEEAPIAEPMVEMEAVEASLTAEEPESEPLFATEPEPMVAPEPEPEFPAEPEPDPVSEPLFAIEPEAVAVEPAAAEPVAAEPEPIAAEPEPVVAEPEAEAVVSEPETVPDGEPEPGFWRFPPAQSDWPETPQFGERRSA